MVQSFFTVEDLTASYSDDATVVNDVSFVLSEGELGCLLGPSGCGKTTILRAISGFQNIRAGNIVLDGTTLCDDKSSIAPEKRNVGMVFQDHALFPHLTLADNVGFGLHQLSKPEQQERINTLLEMVGMGEFKHQYPHELSGGQSQRVALARAIAPQPKLLLMDEPFSNLDAELRESLGYEVRALLKKLGMTGIMVTHDQHDAFALGDQVGVMSEGEMMQWDSCFNLYHAPNNRFVANFIGDGVFIQGQIISDNIVDTKFGKIHGQTINRQDLGKNVDLFIRPDDVKHDPKSLIRGKVIRKAFKGAQTQYTIATENAETLLSLMPSHDNYNIGDVIGVVIKADHLVCFEQKTL